MKKLALIAVSLFAGVVAFTIDPVQTMLEKSPVMSEADARGKSRGSVRREARGVSRRADRSHHRRDDRKADRRKDRRQHRRIHRRHHYYRHLPRGCVRVIIRGIRYWDCGGIYYRAIVEAGETVYIIVTP